MPTYCFQLKDGLKKIEVAMSVKAMLRRRRADGTFKLDEGVAVRDFEAEHKGGSGPTGDRAWPLLCDASGVHPSQINEARAAAEKAGVPTEFAPDGRAVLRSRGHRAKFLKSIGLHDRAGGYMES